MSFPDIYWSLLQKNGVGEYLSWGNDAEPQHLTIVSALYSRPARDSVMGDLCVRSVKVHETWRSGY